MTTHDLQAFSREMVELLMQLLRGVTRRETHALARGRLSLPQFVILEALNQQPQLTMQDLARRASVTKGAMTGAVDRLARAGHVRRHRDAHDRRVVWVRATPRGKAVVHQVRLQKRRTISDLFQRVSQRDRDVYLGIFRRICASFSRP